MLLYICQNKVQDKGYSIWMYIGGGGGVERSPIKKSWGEGVKMKKLGVYMKKKSWGGLKLWAFQPPPPPINGKALMNFGPEFDLTTVLS